MQTGSNDQGTWAGGWLIAALAGLVAAVLARMIGDVGMTAAIFIGFFVFLIFGVLLGSGGVARTTRNDAGAGGGHAGSEIHGAHSAASAVPVSAAPAPIAPAPVPAEILVSHSAVAAPAPTAMVAVSKPDVVPATEPDVASSPVIETVAADVGVARQPTGLSAPRSGKADDLKTIEGIGPATERLCNELGFFHLDQIAGWTSPEIAWVDANLKGFKGRVTRDRWVAQAKLVGEVGIEEFRRRAKTNDY